MNKGLLIRATLLGILLCPTQTIAGDKNSQGYNQGEQKWQHYRSHRRFNNEHPRIQGSFHRDQSHALDRIHRGALESPLAHYRRSVNRQHNRWHAQAAQYRYQRYHHYSQHQHCGERLFDSRHSHRIHHNAERLAITSLLNSIYTDDHR